MCTAGALEGCRAPRCKEDGYTALRFIPDIVGGWVVSDCDHRNQPRRKSTCRQYRDVRWFLLPEGEFRLRLDSSR